MTASRANWPNDAASIDGGSVRAQDRPLSSFPACGGGHGGTAMRQIRQAVMWGCIGWLSACPYYDLRSNVVPLEFGMTPEAVAAALNAPLAYVSGRRGSEIYYAERPSVSGLYNYDRQLWLQFRKGHLTGWKNDWDRRPWW